MSARSDRSSAEQLKAPLAEVDPEIAALIGAESARASVTLSMIASENLVPHAVLDANGSILTNKYADGYPGHREYDGCEVVDEIESIAIARAKKLFGAEHANVQAYSGSNANAAVLQTLCSPGDAVLGFDFEHGGHPTHYDPQTFAGRFYEGHAYHLRRADRLVDMDEVAQLAASYRPRVIFAGWCCYQRFLDFAAFREIADSIGAYLVVDMAHFAGLVAAGLHPDPLPYADVCTMTTHKTLGGARGGAILCRASLADAIDAAVFPGAQGCPLMQVIAAKAVTFGLCATPQFRSRVEQTVRGARIVAQHLYEAEDQTEMTVVTGGTDVHQFLIDTSRAGQDAVAVLERLHAISINANAMRIGFDPQAPPKMSGLRFGTAQLATRGFDDGDFAELGAVLSSALLAGADLATLRARIGVLATAHPMV